MSSIQISDFFPKGSATDPGVCGGSKHYGKGFPQVAEEDPGYIGWAIAKLDQEGAQGWVKKLAEWGKAHGYTSSSGRAQQQRQQQQQQAAAAHGAAPDGAAAPPRRHRRAVGCLVHHRLRRRGRAARGAQARARGRRGRSAHGQGLAPRRALARRVHAHAPQHDPPEVQVCVGAHQRLGPHGATRRGTPRSTAMAYWVCQVPRGARLPRQATTSTCFKLDLADQSAAGFDEDAHRLARGNALDGAEAGPVLAGPRLADAAAGRPAGARGRRRAPPPRPGDSSKRPRPRPRPPRPPRPPPRPSRGPSAATSPSAT